ncbi:MAG TPA: hypothetical protein VI076_14145 [Actinopolymorphaceae bacterium]
MSIEVERRLSALEAAQERTDQVVTRVARRVDRLEDAFDTQWAVLRRLELEALETRKEMHVGFREMRGGFAMLGARLGVDET